MKKIMEHEPILYEKYFVNWILYTLIDMNAVSCSAFSGASFVIYVASDSLVDSELGSYRILLEVLVFLICLLCNFYTNYYYLFELQRKKKVTIDKKEPQGFSEMR